MVVAPFVKYIFYRGVLPLSLLFAAFIRPCFISSVYVVLALLSPVLPSIHAALPLPTSIHLYSWVCFLYSLLAAVAMVAYQIYTVVTMPNEKDYFMRCSDTDLRWIRYTGLIRFHGGDGFESAKAILPEIVAVVAATACAVVVSILPHRSENLDVVGPVRPVRMPNDSPVNKKQSAILMALKRFSNFAIIVLAALVGCVQPSILNCIYFLSFLFVASWWAMYKPLRHQIYNKIKKSLLFYAAIHILTIYVYQIPVVQGALPGDSVIARVVGLSPILLTNCQRWWTFWLNNSLQWPAILNPMILLVFYHVLMLQLLWTYNGSRDYVDDNDGNSSVHEELLLSGSKNSRKKRQNVDDERLDAGADESSSSRGRPLLGPIDGEDGSPGQAIPMRKVTSQVVDRHKIGQIFGPVNNEAAAAASKGMVAIIAFTLYHSYTFALLSMMVWALLYHSIFGLILLVVTCTLWMFKDSRRASFAMAPTITTYIVFLLLTQYACSMNVTPKELQMPDWLKMIGFVMAGNMLQGFITLTVKLLLSLPVFLLLRLSVRETFYEALTEHERARRIQSYGTFEGDTNAIAARNLAGTDVAADWLQWLFSQFTKGSIFLVALVLLVVACQSHPVLYTIGFFCIWSLLIVYFKASFGFFCRIAYPFWLSLIIYTSVVIISLYVYQFPNFPSVWTRWTGLDKSWNDDIGLINYSNVGESGTLFVRLFTPISLFVVTMLQLKFFHEPWMAMVRRGPQDQDAPSAEVLGICGDYWKLTEDYIKIMKEEG